MMRNIAQIKAIEKKNKERILKHCIFAKEESGIYVFSRVDENGIKHAYVGQAKNLLNRLASHLSGYQYIDLSIKKHGLWSAENDNGYMINTMAYDEEKLDEKEKYWILWFSNEGYQLKNKTSGGQGEGKSGIAENKPSKGYYDGLKQGYKKAQKEVAMMFKYLTIDCDKEKKRSVNAFNKFNEFLGGE